MKQFYNLLNVVSSDASQFETMTPTCQHCFTRVCISIVCLKDFGDSADIDQLLEALDTHDPDQAFAKLRKAVPDQVYYASN